MEEARYALFGLTIASAVPLPELRPAPADAAVDVTVRVGPVPEPPGADPGLTMAGGDAVLIVPRVARYRMSDGREMVVEPAEDAEPRNVRLYLVGSAIAAILHQRGLVPLHANAVAVEGRAIAFLGHQGAGKSTLAAWFHDRGFPILADDVCVVTSPESAPLAHPGPPRLRLWREALDATGRDAADYEPSFAGFDKYDVPTREGPAPSALPLGAVYVLEKAEAGEAGIERLRGSAAVGALVANTYRGAYLPKLGRVGPHFIACTALARSVPVFRARRAWGFAGFDAGAARLEAHAREIIAAMDSSG